MLSSRISSSSALNDFHNSSIYHNALYEPTHSSIDFESEIYQAALAQLQQATLAHQNYGSTPNSRATVSVHHPHPTTLPPHGSSGRSLRHDSGLADSGISTQDCMQAQYNSMGGATHHNIRDIEAVRSHQRTPSTSTTVSNQPASPFVYIANTEHSPASPSFYNDPTLFSKTLDNNFYITNQGAPMSSAHLAMKQFTFNHHSIDPDFSQVDFAPSRQSMSSYGTDSPATPQSGTGDMDAKPYAIPQNEYQRNPNVQLFRTESQAFQDELFDPNTLCTSAPTKSAKPYLAPRAHRNLLGERLQTANLARSNSPTSGVSRDRSPFRDGSPHAPTRDWNMQVGPVGTAASMRLQQKEEAAQAEYAQHRTPLRREQTKTISPKDALLEYHENDQAPLFQDSIPVGYEKHMGGTEQWPNNGYLNQPGASFGGLTANGQPTLNFRNATADNSYSGSTLDFSHGLPHANEQVQNYRFQASYQAAAVGKMNNGTEATPDFPATIPSMETSISDAGIPPSSQESIATGPTSTPQRPDDTRANTGTYTCTYHGCTQRFDSHPNLQKHKRDYHRSQQQMREGTSTSGTASVSPRSTGSPAPTSGSGMTSAAILARNSQAGPHKCTRINPSTNKPCNTIFSRPYDLTRHEDTIHNNRKQKVRCPMCREEKTFSRNDALTRHMRVVHPEVESFGKRGRRGD